MTTDMPDGNAMAAWLEQFSEKYANRQRIHDIPSADREQWGRFNIATKGVCIPKFMTIKVWGASPGTLTSAAMLIRRYVPSLVKTEEAVERTVALLEDAARRQKNLNRTTSPHKITPEK